MLQQTQVATVVPYFLRFMNAFPTAADLAAAPEQQVLRLWQGLGYYSRARNLQAAARQIITEFNSRIPSSVPELTTLPGVGKYTAGAIASIAFNQRAPILDGNVSRVLCRLNLIQSDPKDPKTREHLWQRAKEILPISSTGDFNSALMELGATICTPKSPKCPACPVRKFCKAARAGLQDTIPQPRKSLPTPLFKRWTICVSRSNRWLIERRPDKGRWAGLWQFPTIEAQNGKPTPTKVGHQIAIQIGELHPIGELSHALTHRKYNFKAFTAQASGAETIKSGATRHWITLGELNNYPLSKPQSLIAQMLHPDKHPLSSSV
jgi:A/G-specific adenine glycosylase